ncbi:MAG: hypothetical protein RBS73_17695 [Prolixibacteraceae bacterium]|nr:hypothetical protein [Prolixibacteraceae bacterium]
MKKVLIVTYYWPPSGGAGVQRWLKFVKYLPQFGIQPVVLTVDPAFASYPQTDESLLHEIAPETEVYRTRSFELYQFYSRLSKKKEIPYGGFANETHPSLFQKISRFVRGNFLLPDPRKGWNKYAYQKAVELIAAHSIDTVITTGPPHSTHLTGLKLQQKNDIRWVADLRDPWTDIYYYRQFYHTSLARFADRRMERKVLEKANQIIMVSQDLLRLFNLKTTVDLQRKTSILPNGFDEDDFLNKAHQEEEKFTITYTGTISEMYDISGFIAALKKIDQAIIRNSKIRFVGKVPSAISNRIKDEFPEMEMELTGYVNHQQSVGYLLRSSLLLLVIPKVENNGGILTGKFFEYLASRKPVLAIGPVDGDLAAIIRETACGKIFGYADKDGISSFVEAVFNAEWKTVPKNVEAYSRKGLTEKLSRILISSEK